MNDEIIVPIKGFGDKYVVSNKGRVFRKDPRKGLVEVKGWIENVRGYRRIELNNKPVMVHRLVAEAFIPNPENKEQVNHKDENKLNNCAENLEWVTNAENHNYGTRNARTGKALQKPILKISIDNGKVLQRYNSLKDAVKDGFNHSAVSRCANHIGCKQSGGYRWEWECNYVQCIKGL